MNTIKNFKFYILTTLALLALNACVQDDDFALPPIECNDVWQSNVTITELFAQVDAAGDILAFDTDQIVEGYVVSSDSTGNFFKTVSIQDSRENPSRALQVEMDRTNLFNNFPLGSKIKVNLRGLNVGYDRGALKIGETYESNGTIRVGRMAEFKIDDHVVRSCDAIEDATPVVYNSIDEAIDVEGAAQRINTLVTIQNVQFAQTGVTYADAPTQTTVNLTLEGATAETNEERVVLRTSGFADFADVVVPDGSGSITAVLSAYDSNNNGSITSSEYQLFIRDTDDVNFDQPRYGSSDTGSGPIGGTSTSYEACVNEDFSSFDTGDSEFPNYINDAAVGTRYWEVKDFGGNNYIQMSAFNSTDNSNDTYFIVPVDFSNADSFSFKTKDGYDNGAVLSVYYSTDYELLGDVSAATLVDITSSFTISSGNTNGYGANFIESGDYSLSSINGNGVIVFKYSGSGSGATTTMQIDDIMVMDNDDPDCGSGGGGTGGGIGGGSASFDNCLNEPFSTYADYQNEFPKYENYAVEGTRYWETRSFDGNSYIQFSSFNSTDAANKTYFIVPVDFSNADSFSFKTKDGYNNGDPLKVYYSTNYTIGSDITTATLTEITSNFTISTGNTGGYGANFIESGSYSLSGLSGNGVLLFYYEGAANGVTTTMQIDDITISDNEDPDCGGGGGGDPVWAFPGGDFENWTAFLGGLNSFGIKDYATESPGNGIDGTTALSINMASTSGNDYVFTTLAYADLPNTYSTLKFFVKGTSDKSLSINLYKTDGTYYRFNLGDISGNATVAVSGNNQYTGIIDTGGQWAEITLDLSGITDLNTSDTSSDFFALKVGKDVPYNLFLDNFTIQ